MYSDSLNLWRELDPDLALAADRAMRASRRETRERTNLLTATPDEVALAVACFLGTARTVVA